MENLQKVEKILEPKRFVQLSFMEKMGFNNPARCCSVVQSDTITMNGNGKVLFSFDILSNVLKFAKNYTYLDFLGVVVSGQWLIPKDLPGTADVVLLDERLSGNASIIAKFRCNAGSQFFQFKFSPGYSLTVSDAAKKPFKLFATVNGLPVKEGYNPLSLEIACLVRFCNSVIDRGLTAKLNALGSSARNMSEDDVDGLIGDLPVLKAIAGTKKSKIPINGVPLYVKNKKGKKLNDVPKRRVKKIVEDLSASEDSESVYNHDLSESETIST